MNSSSLIQSLRNDLHLEGISQSQSFEIYQNNELSFSTMIQTKNILQTLNQHILMSGEHCPPLVQSI